MKLKTARELVAEVNENHRLFPFSLHQLHMSFGKARLGATEALRYNILKPCQVMEGRNNELLVRAKFTVFVMPKRTIQATKLPVAYGLVDDKINVDALVYESMKNYKK